VEPFGGWHFTGPQAPAGGVSSVFRPIYKGVLIAAGGFDREKAIRDVEEGHDDLVGFGRDFIGTPDLVKRLRVNAPFNEYNTKTFYIPVGTPNELGYTDYPVLQDN
jgi:N-ethylmaleimide reductase